jgi:multisubunit Na+/H+ antiporter MnhC subunit
MGKSLIFVFVIIILFFMAVYFLVIRDSKLKTLVPVQIPTTVQNNESK